MQFERKFIEIKKIESINKAIGFIFSSCGFTAEAEIYCQEKGIACSADKQWISI